MYYKTKKTYFRTMGDCIEIYTTSEYDASKYDGGNSILTKHCWVPYCSINSFSSSELKNESLIEISEEQFLIETRL